MASQKEATIARLEEWIISGELKVGQRLPPERVLAAKWLISRPVLHEALVEVARKGFVRIVPRHGVYVADFRTLGSVDLLKSLVEISAYSSDSIFGKSLFEMQAVVQCDAARLAALRRTDEQVQQMYALLEPYSSTLPFDTKVDIFIQFFQLIDLASQNLFYPLMINALKPVFSSIAAKFLGWYPNDEPIRWVKTSSMNILRAIEARDSEAAHQSMKEFIHSAALLYQQQIPEFEPSILEPEIQ